MPTASQNSATYLPILSQSSLGNVFQYELGNGNLVYVGVEEESGVRKYHTYNLDMQGEKILSSNVFNAGRGSTDEFFKMEDGKYGARFSPDNSNSKYFNPLLDCFFFT